MASKLHLVTPMRKQGIQAVTGDLTDAWLPHSQALLPDQSWNDCSSGLLLSGNTSECFLEGFL